MTYRGVYRDGIVILQGEVGLENGAFVDVSPREAGARGKGGTRRGAKGRASDAAGKRAKALRDHPAFGMWKDRPEWKGLSTAEIAALLREKAMGQGKGKTGRGRRWMA